jgi:hypothetical protein
MSGYDYAYNVAPARSTGWGSLIAGFFTIVTVVAVAGISGAVVTLELIAPQSPHADASADVPARSRQASVTPPRSAPPQHVAVVTPRTTIGPMPESVTQHQQPLAQMPEQDQDLRAAVAPAPAPSLPQPTIAAAPPPPAASVVPDSELTFAKGYAQRRAAQEAASIAAHSAGGKVAAVSQLGRAAVLRKPNYARNYASLARHRYAWRGEATGYYDGPGGFDFRRREALAYGDEQRPPRRVEPRGGFFGKNNSNSWF